MAKIQNKYYCMQCGAEYPKWIGKCEDCGQWSSIVEHEHVSVGGIATSSKVVEYSTLDCGLDEPVTRAVSGITEFDRVCGGGIVPGSIILIGGEPGIGKSTLLLQTLAALSNEHECAYISGEESKEQICLRAQRLGLSKAKIKLACENDIQAVLESLPSGQEFLVIDSIQTLMDNNVDSTPGSITQIKSCSASLINFAKKNNTAVFLVGHITKDGSLAGPKLLEHMVDTVLYFEGERGNSYRLLRAIKNRFGSCGEVGIFEMKEAGLFSVENPSEIFLHAQGTDLPGNVVFAGIEGSRPILVEVQALVTKTYFPSPKRTVVGCDLNRLLTIIAVLESRCKISFADRDVYLNIAGGLKITEPAGDLAIAISLISARLNMNIPCGTCAFGEIGLTGEIRSVSKIAERVNEARKLNFNKIIAPICEDCNGTESFKTVLECAKSMFSKENT